MILKWQIREREGNKKSIPTNREREGNEKNPFPLFGNGKGMKETHSHISGMGIRGYHSHEYQGTGTRMKKKMIRQYKNILRKYVA